MPPLEEYGEVKSWSQESNPERVKLNSWNKTETGLKILTLNKSLTRLPLLLAQIKTGSYSKKLKN